MIVNSAIKILATEKILVGRRHSDIIQQNAGLYSFTREDSVQGFVNDRGDFLTRRQANNEAIRCGQAKRWMGDNFTSEELW